MRLKLVFAKSSCWVSTPEGIPWFINFGTHWAADDPLVLKNPDLFSDDPLIGLNYSDGYKPAEMAAATSGEPRVPKRP